jgi:hypothetical protein
MRKTGIALSAFALAMTLGACGGNGSGDSGNTNTNTNTNAPAEAAGNVADLAKSIGDQATAKNSAHLTMSGNFGGEEMTGEGDVSFDATNPAMSIDMKMSSGDVSMLLVDQVVYIKVPGQEIDGKPWLRIDTNSDNPLAKVFATMSEQMSKNADPRTALEQFKEAGEVTDSKTEELDGKQTTHYTITVDVQKLADAQTDPTQKAGLDAAIKAGLKDFPVEVWIDEEQLPVRVAFDMPAPDGKGGTATAQMQMDYTDWGKPIDVTAPPADQVAEMPES